jgi:hypothetical protein
MTPDYGWVLARMADELDHARHQVERYALPEMEDWQREEIAQQICQP